MPDREVLATRPVDGQPQLPPPFSCSWGWEDVRSAWVSVTGELDIATVPELETALTAAQRDARLVNLDLEGLSFMALAGVHAIKAASERAAIAGHRLTVTHGPRNVRAVFVFAGITDEICFIDTV